MLMSVSEMCSNYVQVLYPAELQAVYVHVFDNYYNGETWELICNF